MNPDYVPFDLVTPDQKRADVWIAELQQYVRDGNMPQLELMWLPMDHLAAGRPGKCTPRACMADNDLAPGRIVQALWCRVAGAIRWSIFHGRTTSAPCRS